MAQNEQYLADDTPTNSVYKLMSLGANEAIYRDEDSTLVNPRLLRVSHQPASNDAGIDRHLVQLSRSDDDEDGVPYTGTVHVVIAQPRSGVAIADLELEWEKLKNLVDANFAELAAGFMPETTAP
jgi:hypothetical protein